MPRVLIADMPLRTFSALALISFLQPLSAAITFQDVFSGSGAPGPNWVTDTQPDSTSNATVNVSNGSLDVLTGNVNGLSIARHTLELVTPTVTLKTSWTIDFEMTIDGPSAFNTIAPGEGVGISFGVRNPDNTNGTDRAQINFVLLDFGSGPDFAVRGQHQTAGVESAIITNLGAASSALTGTGRLSYDQTTGMLTHGLDTGSGFFQLLDPVDTTAWNMASDDPLELQLEMGMVKFNGDPAASTFAIDAGEVSLDTFPIYDEALTIVPEPSTAAAMLGLIALGTTVLNRRRR